MKKLISVVFCLLTLAAYSQSQFDSEVDVLLYLTNIRSFTNQEANVTLTFSDMGSALSSGNAKYYNPTVTLVTSTKAIVGYQSLNNPDVAVQFVVDCQKNEIIDKQDGSIFKAYSFEDDNKKGQSTKRIQTQSSKNNLSTKRDPNPRKDFANVFYNPKYTLFDLFTDEPIFPDSRGVYHIYAATNENKIPKPLKGNAQEISEATVYKFKNYKNCKAWCDGKKHPVQN